LQLYIGSNVTIFDSTIFTGLKVLNKPKLYIGDNTYIGPWVWLSVGKEIKIGSYCVITSKLITDNPGHPRNTISRLESASGIPDPDDIRPVKIGDFCWLRMDTYVYPGVTIGDGVVALAGTHISEDIPPFCLVAGSPGKIIKKLPIPEELIEVVGKEKYESYLESHRILDL
jgi:acetyltransferase-like isoleucine patch superfamily enzyme